MGDQQHLDWLREGVSSWNNRRQQTPFKPDLEDADISAAIGVHARADIRQIAGDLRGINLSGANLKNAILRDTDLTGSHFYSTDLTEANLVGSRFDGSMFVNSRLTRADLHSASLNGTRVWMTNLDHAKLVGASAASAEFWQCSLDRAHLYSTNLRDARFILSKPWQANLFWNPNQDTVKTATLKIQTINGINDLLTVVRDLRTVYSGNTTLYFRGESREFDALKPSVMRNPKPTMPPLKLFEAEMLTDLLTQQPDAFNSLGSTWSQWVMAQHHRLQTRLLDITRNPLVALFFASNDHQSADGRLHVFAVPKSVIKPFNSDQVDLIANFAKLPRAEQNFILGKTAAEAVQDAFPPEGQSPQHGPQLFADAVDHLNAMIRRERPDHREQFDIRDLYRVFVVEPQQIFDRIKAQAGAFLLSAFHERFERPEILKISPDTTIYAHHILKISAGNKDAIIRDLRSFNVDRETLFPNVDETAIAITQAYLARSP